MKRYNCGVCGKLTTKSADLASDNGVLCHISLCRKCRAENAPRLAALRREWAEESREEEELFADYPGD